MYMQLQSTSTMTRPPTAARRSAPDSTPGSMPNPRSSSRTAASTTSTTNAELPPPSRPDVLPSRSTTTTAASASSRGMSQPPEPSLPPRRSSKRRTTTSSSSTHYNTLVLDTSTPGRVSSRVAVTGVASLSPSASEAAAGVRRSNSKRSSNNKTSRRSSSKRSPAASPSPDDKIKVRSSSSSRRRSSSTRTPADEAAAATPRHRPSSRTTTSTRPGPDAGDDDDQGRGSRRASTLSLPVDLPTDVASSRRRRIPPGGAAAISEEQGGRRRSSHSLPADMPPPDTTISSSRPRRAGPESSSTSRRRSSATTMSSSPPTSSEMRAKRRSSGSGGVGRTTAQPPPKGPPNSPPVVESSSSNISGRRSIRRMSNSNKTNGGTYAVHQPQQQQQQQEPVMTAVYRHARRHEWDQMINHCRLFPDEAKYVHPLDGTTALHVAVMSRTGYSPPVQEEVDGTSGSLLEPKEPCPAPMDVIENLLLMCPESANVVCKINSYTPLAYACLVSGEEWNLEDSAAMVRLFLQHARESLSIFTEGGLSALDVHIISFSYKKREQQAEDNVMSGRTSTVVLRTLLEADPCLAHVRIRKDKVGGPIELLYRCNSGAFLDAVDLDDKSYMKKRAENDKSVIGTIKDWWVWKWTVLLLKYGTVPYKKKGAPFLTVQAAAGMVGCPLPVLTLAIRAFPKQIRQRDAMQGHHGNLPLHQVATWPCQQDSESMDPVISSRKGMAISALLQEYPEAAQMTNNLNETALELAVATGTTWDGGVRKLVRVYPQGVSIPSPSTRLLPFLAAAAAASDSSSSSQQDPPPPTSSKRSFSMHLKAIAKRDLQSVRTIYGLLRADPMVLTKLYCYDYED